MDLNNQEVRKTKVLKDIQPDEKLAEEIQSNLDKQLKEKQRCQEQKISSLQIAVILQGIAVIILGIGGIILKKYLP